MIVGIDLGTTNSLVAVWRDGKPQLLPNALGEVLTPSCVSVDEDGSILVGRAARERVQTHPDRTARAFKRAMGSNKTFALGKQSFRPEELSALVLKSLKADAEAALGEPVTEAIITVPAYFSDAQRKATRAAGQLAGLKVERLLNEPTAASLAYGIHQLGAETRFLVFDLGGGTFDVSILEMFEGVMEVRASAGDNFLGGEDFVDALVDRFFAEHELSPNLRRNALFMQRLAGQAEAAKCALSTSASATMLVSQDDRTLRLEITEALLADAGASLLKRLRAPVERALRDARLRSSELDNIVLAGGATRMPLVRKLVTSMFGRFPALDFNPDEVVALGAAVQAGLKARDAALDDVVMTDVAPYSLGVAVSKKLSATQDSSGHFDPVIERNSPVPISRVKTYWPTKTDQARIDLHIFQGESRMVADNVHLGQLAISLPPGRANDCPVDVRFTYDVNGLLQVEATVQKTGDKFAVLIEGNPGVMDEAEIARRLKALDELKIHPRDMLENRTALARAERIYQMLRGEVREWLANQILVFEAALGTQDRRTVAAAREQLEQQLQEIERNGVLDDEPAPRP
ncbi:molecular chaperone HscC [Ramlibacter sp. G-1-2-2]|uniref:Molecular chaperone HscC n=1 Tax=Ramlibacter agri TaxID=2728837 RepID=A0A848HGQ8_9BURK|nr:molecular chaperone HscC [Ramlibacter agri]NML48640.1 molecular chaperone HscC [Ramlibacter agri]